MEKPGQSAASSSAEMASENSKGHEEPERQRGAVHGGNTDSFNTAKCQAYQFKITLKRSKPPIWRRILVPEDYNFRELHLAIQHAMGWMSTFGDYHLHRFQMLPKSSNPDEIGIPDAYDDPFLYNKTLPGEEVAIASRFKSPGDKALYEYDFGDGWEHDILLEKVVPPIAGTLYPRCINGKRTCPPEDCGGLWGFKELLEILANPRHEEYQEKVDWLEFQGFSQRLGGGFDFNEFDPKNVMFFNTKSLTN